MWVKSFPINDDEESWLIISPNVNVARRCLLFERIEYCRRIVGFEKLVEEGIAVERDVNEMTYTTLYQKEKLKNDMYLNF